MEVESNTDTEEVMEFNFPLPLKKASNGLAKRHTTIESYLQVPNDENLIYTFDVIVSLCNPFTQPEEGYEVFSVDFLADLAISLLYNRLIANDSTLPIESVKFDMSVLFFKLLQHVTRALNADDELSLRFVNNDLTHYLKNLHKWTPHVGFHDWLNLKIVYSLACVLLMALYKLFKPASGDYNLIMNPYLHYFLKQWKCHTNIIVLGLEIDRRLEAQNHEENTNLETPEIIKLVLQGSSAIRCVLSWIINQNPSLNCDNERTFDDLFEDYDIVHESAINFLQPLARKKTNGGSLRIDMRSVIIGLLILNSGMSSVGRRYSIENPSCNEEAVRRENHSSLLGEVGDILIDLEYDDRFDEDIGYVFECEYDGSEAEWLDVEEEKEHENHNQDQNQIVESHKVEALQDENQFEIENNLKSGGESDDSINIEFDELGRDWRDISRNENTKLEPWFTDIVHNFDKLLDKQQSDDFFANWDEVYQTLEFLSTTTIEGDLIAEKRVGQVLINTVSLAVKNQVENVKSSITATKICDYFQSLASEEATLITQNNNKMIVPIYDITKFELLLHNNNKLARCLMDELLMCDGYRRIIIWFMTHYINLSSLLIDYVFELLVGYRGSKKTQLPYKFTRQGQKVILSEVEQLMLLHEFLVNCNAYLSATDGIEIDSGHQVVLAESVAKKLMTLLCLMITQLIKFGVIDLHNDTPDEITDYRTEIQVLLISWVGKLPEARTLFFELDKSRNGDLSGKDTQPKDKNDDNILTSETVEEAQAELFKKYESLTSTEITQDLQVNSNHRAIIEFFTVRIQLHVDCVLQYSHNTVAEHQMQLTQISKDFKLFMDNFNTLSKIDFLCEKLFTRFEHVVCVETREPMTPVGDPALVLEPVESEFNQQFLDGKGNFEDPKPQQNKKKKKKKSKKK
jgi:hypothetical protein